MSRPKTQFHARAAWCAIPVVALFLALGPGSEVAHAGRFIGVVNPFASRCTSAQDSGDCLSNRDLGRMRRTHIKLVRWGFRWPTVQPVPGEHKWRTLDDVIGALASRGVRVLPVMTGSPPWVAPTYGTAPVKTRLARKSWRRFLKASVERYGPGGDYWTDPDLYRATHPQGKPKPIRTWQIWNEPNIRGGAQHVRPGGYARLVRISHDAIVDADPKAKILLAGMPGYVRTRAWAYLNRLYRHRGFKRQFDGVALHPYAGDVRHVLVQIRAMRRVMKWHHDRRAPLWITELGWGSKRPSKSQPINKGPRGQKLLLKVTFPLLRKSRHAWHIRHAFWFRWRDPPPDFRGCTFCSSSGLLRNNQRPKPAWRAFRKITRRH